MDKTDTGEVARWMGRLAYHFSLVRPGIPTFLGLMLAAVFPIYCGAHASLKIPSSAAKRKTKKKQKQKQKKKAGRYGDESEDDGDGDEAEGDSESEDDDEDEASWVVSELRPEDALWFPLLGGCLLGGLYLVIKYLDAKLLNRILNAYFSCMCVPTSGRLLADSMATATSYVFPRRWRGGARSWHLRRGSRAFVAVESGGAGRHEGRPSKTTSPLPGWLSKIHLGGWAQSKLWTVRETLTDRYLFRVFVRGQTLVKSTFGLVDILGFVAALVAVAAYNFINQHWSLVDLFALGLSYSSLQLISPSTFWTGTMVLSSLFCYDIYMVFFTPLMVTVAQALEVPIKLLIPRPRSARDDPSLVPLAMLGLGDVVLPGMLMALALRFDLYLWYLRKQTRRPSADPAPSEDGSDEQTIDRPMETVKAPYRPATGRWGERFWTGSAGAKSRVEGGSFPKPYFRASVVGYIGGMIVTFGVLAFSGHAQPALLYLVPGVLVPVWGLAVVRDELREMWEYVDVVEEDDAAEGKGKKDGNGTERPSGSTTARRSDSPSMNKEPAGEGRPRLRSAGPSSPTTGKPDATASVPATSAPRSKEDPFLCITIRHKAYSPRSRTTNTASPTTTPSGAGTSSPKTHSSPTIVKEIRDALDGDLDLRATTASPSLSSSSSSSSSHHHYHNSHQHPSNMMHHRASTKDNRNGDALPLEKRPRLDL